jgi:deoxyribonuclease V
MGGNRGPGLFAAADVYYPGAGGARAAAVVAADAAFTHVLAEYTARTDDVLPYQPGQFYLRELPPLRAVLHGIPGLGLLVVDGYADLDPAGRPGLGAHAHTEFGIPVIGVAKSAFRTATHAIAVQRGTSPRPVFVTAAGLCVTEAAGLIANMVGRFRIPDALRRADQLAHTAASSSPVELPPARNAATGRSGSQRHTPAPSASSKELRSPVWAGGLPPLSSRP